MKIERWTLTDVSHDLHAEQLTVGARDVGLPPAVGWSISNGFDEWIVRCGLDSNGAPGTDTIVDNNGNPVPVSRAPGNQPVLAALGRPR